MSPLDMALRRLFKAVLSVAMAAETSFWVKRRRMGVPDAGRRPQDNAVFCC
jgi:hypothetical protein